MDKSCLPPILKCTPVNTKARFITASELKTQEIARQQNDRYARKMDAAKILIEARMGLYDEDFTLLPIDVANIMSHAEKRKRWQNQAFHFKDEKNFW